MCILFCASRNIIRSVLPVIGVHYLSGLYASFVLKTRRISVLFVLRKDGERPEPGALFGGEASRTESNDSGELTRSTPPEDSEVVWLSLETLRGGGGGVAYGGRVLEDGIRLMPGMLGDGKGDCIGRGLGGAMMPCEIARRGLGRSRDKESRGSASNNDLKREPLWTGVGT